MTNYYTASEIADEVGAPHNMIKYLLSEHTMYHVRRGKKTIRGYHQDVLDSIRGRVNSPEWWEI